MDTSFCESYTGGAQTSLNVPTTSKHKQKLQKKKDIHKKTLQVKLEKPTQRNGIPKVVNPEYKGFFSQEDSYTIGGELAFRPFSEFNSFCGILAALDPGTADRTGYYLMIPRTAGPIISHVMRARQINELVPCDLYNVPRGPRKGPLTKQRLREQGIVLGDNLYYWEYDDDRRYLAQCGRDDIHLIRIRPEYFNAMAKIFEDL